PARRQPMTGLSWPPGQNARPEQNGNGHRPPAGLAILPPDSQPAVQAPALPEPVTWSPEPPGDRAEARRRLEPSALTNARLLAGVAEILATIAEWLPAR